MTTPAAKNRAIAQKLQAEWMTESYYVHRGFANTVRKLRPVNLAGPEFTTKLEQIFFGLSCSADIHKKYSFARGAFESRKITAEEYGEQLRDIIFEAVVAGKEQ